MNLVKSMEEALNKMYSTKEEKNGDKIKLSKKKEKVNLNPKIEDEMTEAKPHNCATHVEHSEWGAGTCIPTQHTLIETERGEFEVTHYDVLFDDGVKEDVPVGDLKILKEKHHSHDPDDPHEHPHKNGEEDHDCDEVHPGKSHKEWEKENVEKEARTYLDRKDDEKEKKKKHFAFGGKKKSRHGVSGYGKGEEVEVENEEVELTELLKSKDKSVIDAFYNKDSLAGRVLSTSGKSLEKHGVGGQTIAAWLKGKIAITAVSDVKSTQAILRYMKNSIPKGNFDPKSWNKFFEEVEIEEVEVDGRTRGYRTALTRINTRRERVEAKKGSVREVSPPDWEGTVKKMKKEKNIDNPWALAWYMKNKGYTPHATEQEWIQNSGSESFKVWEKHFIPEAYEDGTDEYKKHVKKMTPGQEEVEIEEGYEKVISLWMKRAFSGVDFHFKNGILYVDKGYRGKVARRMAGDKMKPPVGGIKEEVEIDEAPPKSVADYLKFAKAQRGKGPEPVSGYSADKWAKEIKKGVDAPWVSSQTSSLGPGDPSVMIKLTLDAEKDWPNNILHNARFGMLRIDPAGEMEMFASHRKLKNMRKTKIKSSRDAIQKINTWIKTVKEEVELEEVESKYAAAIAAYKKKGGKVKKLKDSPAFKSLFKQKGPKKPPRKEEVEVDEAKSKLPPHLAKFFDKDGNLKKDAAARVAKGREKINWIDVTPKGYGPKEEDTKHYGGQTMMKFKQAMGEAFFKVNIPDMPPVFIEGGSASAIKQDMRKKLKPDVLKGLEIEKVSRADMAKMYRKLAKGDSEEGETQEEVSESMKLQATMALGDAGIKTNWKGGKLYVPKKDIKKAEKALSKSFRKGGEPDLYHEEVVEATGDKAVYQKKREAIAKKFGVTHGGEIKDPKKKKAYYNALDKSHVSDDEEKTKKEGVKMSVVKRFLSERRGKIQTDEANKATERKVRADYHKMEGDKKRMEKLASKYKMKKDEVQGIIMKEDSWSDQSHKWDESPHNDDRYKLSNAMPHMGVEAKEDMEGPYLYHDKMFFWSPGEQKFWSEDAGNWISDVDAKEMMYSFMKGLWQGRKGALPAIKR